MNIYLMTTMIVAVLVSFTLPVEASFEEELKAYKKRAKCNYAIRANLYQYEWIFGHWLAPNQSKWNIYENFKVLQAYNKGRYVQIDKLIEKSLRPPKSFHELQEFIRKLDGEQTNVSTLITDLRSTGYRFSLSMVRLERAINSLKIETKYLKNKCKQYDDVMDGILKSAVSWQEDIVLLREYVEKNRVVIENFHLMALQVARLNAFRKYIDLTNEKIDAVNGKLKNALELDRQYGRFLSWWHRVSTQNKLGDGLHLKYLQYRHPLRVMAAQLVIAKDFHVAILGLDNKDGKHFAITEVTNAIQIIENEIQRLRDLGWRGQLQRQQYLNGVRKERVAPNNPACGRKLQLYAFNTKSIQKEENFKKAELAYVEVLKSCQ